MNLSPELVAGLIKVTRQVAAEIVDDDGQCHRGITTAANCCRCGPILKARTVLDMVQRELRGLGYNKLAGDKNV